MTSAPVRSEIAPLQEGFDQNLLFGQVGRSRMKVTKTALLVKNAVLVRLGSGRLANAAVGAKVARMP